MIDLERSCSKRATAIRFQNEGGRVVVTDLDEAAGMPTAAEVGGQFIKLDVSREADWLRLTKLVPVADVVVNKAGITGFENRPSPHDPDRGLGGLRFKAGRPPSCRRMRPRKLLGRIEAAGVRSGIASTHLENGRVIKRGRRTPKHVRPHQALLHPAATSLERIVAAVPSSTGRHIRMCRLQAE